MFLVKGVLKICNKFTGEHPCRSVISIKLLYNFIGITLRHGCSPVNLLHIFKTPSTKNTSGWLLLLIKAPFQLSYYTIMETLEYCEVPIDDVTKMYLKWNVITTYFLMSSLLIFYFSTCLTFKLLSWFYIWLITISDDVEVTPRPKSKATQTLSICHWNLNGISEHNSSKLHLSRS